MQNDAVGRKWAHCLGGASEKAAPSSGTAEGGAARPKGAASGTIAADRKRREPKLSPCTGWRNWELHHKGLHRWAGNWCVAVILSALLAALSLELGGKGAQ
jgi:hypothetical protein